MFRELAPGETYSNALIDGVAEPMQVEAGRRADADQFQTPNDRPGFIDYDFSYIERIYRRFSPALQDPVRILAG